MPVNVAHKFRSGLKPQAFVEGMTKNKEQFQEWSNAFAWPSEEDQAFFASLSHRDDLRCLILAADWCGDVIRNVPVVLNALADTEIPTEILVMEDHLDLMDEFLTMGGRAIPVVIFADTGGHVLGKWGPRPKHVQEVMIAFKQQNPDRNAPDYEANIKVAREQMLQQYGEGTGYQAVIVKELREILSSL
ncbi:thioredoxin family protein [Brevibacillus invocatus]|uniref:thioredoxin family protein n=1 Tax=Brevibacillus invocatus TaxID=173959 RepID=UPI002040C7B6|nr:thioredoxin family protein [Brevibacillus invocatus]MCM3080977.1 thioredoxin family protein [Brevibacillus invocatus]MCM3431171.1 thioredoxin family protein [Brevibacillus invocatus]